MANSCTTLKYSMYEANADLIRHRDVSCVGSILPEPEPHTLVLQSSCPLMLSSKPSCASAKWRRRLLTIWAPLVLVAIAFVLLQIGWIPGRTSKPPYWPRSRPKRTTVVSLPCSNKRGERLMLWWLDKYPANPKGWLRRTWMTPWIQMFRNRMSPHSSHFTNGARLTPGASAVTPCLVASAESLKPSNLPCSQCLAFVPWQLHRSRRLLRSNGLQMVSPSTFRRPATRMENRPWPKFCTGSSHCLRSCASLGQSLVASMSNTRVPWSSMPLGPFCPNTASNLPSVHGSSAGNTPWNQCLTTSVLSKRIFGPRPLSWPVAANSNHGGMPLRMSLRSTVQFGRTMIMCCTEAAGVWPQGLRSCPHHRSPRQLLSLSHPAPSGRLPTTHPLVRRSAKRTTTAGDARPNAQKARCTAATLSSLPLAECARGETTTARLMTPSSMVNLPCAREGVQIKPTAYWWNSVLVWRPLSSRQKNFSGDHRPMFWMFPKMRNPSSRRITLPQQTGGPVAPSPNPWWTSWSKIMPEPRLFWFAVLYCVAPQGGWSNFGRFAGCWSGSRLQRMEPSSPLQLVKLLMKRVSRFTKSNFNLQRRPFLPAHVSGTWPSCAGGHRLLPATACRRLHQLHLCRQHCCLAGKRKAVCASIASWLITRCDSCAARPLRFAGYWSRWKWRGLLGYQAITQHLCLAATTIVHLRIVQLPVVPCYIPCCQSHWQKRSCLVWSRLCLHDPGTQSPVACPFKSTAVSTNISRSTLQCIGRCAVSALTSRMCSIEAGPPTAPWARTLSSKMLTAPHRWLCCCNHAPKLQHPDSVLSCRLDWTQCCTLNAGRLWSLRWPWSHPSQMTSILLCACVCDLGEAPELGGVASLTFSEQRSTMHVAWQTCWTSVAPALPLEWRRTFTWAGWIWPDFPYAGRMLVSSSWRSAELVSWATSLKLISTGQLAWSQQCLCRSSNSPTGHLCNRCWHPHRRRRIRCRSYGKSPRRNANLVHCAVIGRLLGWTPDMVQAVGAPCHASPSGNNPIPNGASLMMQRRPALTAPCRRPSAFTQHLHPQRLPLSGGCAPCTDIPWQVTLKCVLVPMTWRRRTDKFLSSQNIFDFRLLPSTILNADSGFSQSVTVWLLVFQPPCWDSTGCHPSLLLSHAAGWLYHFSASSTTLKCWMWRVALAPPPGPSYNFWTGWDIGATQVRTKCHQPMQSFSVHARSTLIWVRLTQSGICPNPAGRSKFGNKFFKSNVKVVFLCLRLCLCAASFYIWPKHIKAAPVGSRLPTWTKGRQRITRLRCRRAFRWNWTCTWKCWRHVLTDKCLWTHRPCLKFLFSQMRLFMLMLRVFLERVFVSLWHVRAGIFAGELSLTFLRRFWPASSLPKHSLHRQKPWRRCWHCTSNLTSYNNACSRFSLTIWVFCAISFWGPLVPWTLDASCTRLFCDSCGEASEHGGSTSPANLTSQTVGLASVPPAP